MARKRGEYQRRKERQNKISNILCVLTILLFILLFLYPLIQESVNVYDIDHDSLNTYTGSFEYRINTGFLGRHRSTTYVFTLDNGDVLLVLGRFLENEESLNENKELRFQYSTMYSNPLYGRYSAVSITTTDGEATILDIDRSRRDSVFGIWLFSIMILLCLGLLVALLVMSYYAGDWKRRYEKWRKKRRKMREQIEASK